MLTRLLACVDAGHGRGRTPPRSEARNTIGWGGREGEEEQGQGHHKCTLGWKGGDRKASGLPPGGMRGGYGAAGSRRSSRSVVAPL
jgi:hypothetical protein